MQNGFLRSVPSFFLLALALGWPLAAEEGSKPKAATSTEEKAPGVAPRTRGKLKPVDINRASMETIGFMLGIDAALATKIVEGRPYLTKTQLFTKNILTREQYLALKDRVVVKPL